MVSKIIRIFVPKPTVASNWPAVEPKPTAKLWGCRHFLYSSAPAFAVGSLDPACPLYPGISVTFGTVTACPCFRHAQHSMTKLETKRHRRLGT